MQVSRIGCWAVTWIGWAVLATSLPFVAPRALAQAQDVELPWSKRKPTTSPPPATLPTARELLVNVDESQWAQFQDGAPLSVNEDETLDRILYRLPLFGANDAHRLSAPLVAETVSADPAAYRGQMFRLAGRAVAIEKVAVLPEIARRLDFDYYWQIQVQLRSAPHAVLLCARWIPDGWQNQSQLDEPLETQALFLKTGATTHEHPSLVFACDRVGWLPDKVDATRGISAEHVLLAKYGLDFSYLADLQGRDNKPLGSLDRECFFQMLQAVGQLAESDFDIARPFEFGAFLQNPGHNHGRLAHLTGRVKRITPIRLEDPQLRERFGFDHYYELDMILPLGDRQVRLAGKEQDDQGPVISGGYPVVCCVRELPASLGKITDRRDVNEDMTVDGFFFRMWSYQSSFLDQFALERQEQADDGGPGANQRIRRENRRRQPSPLFVARTAQLVPAIDQGATTFGLIIGGILVGIVVLMFCVHWLTGRGDRLARQRLRNTATL